MFNLFLCLFGAPYWAIRIGVARDREKMADKRIKEGQEKDRVSREQWKALVTDFELEKEIKKIAESQWREEPYFSELSRAIDEINGYSSSWEALKRRIDCKAPFDSDYVGLRTLVLMAKRGKLPLHIAESGISNVYRTSNFLAGYDKTNGLRYSYDLACWVSKTLTECGVANRFVLYKTITGEYEYLTENNYDSVGDYKWEATVPSYAKIKGFPQKA